MYRNRVLYFAGAINKLVRRRVRYAVEAGFGEVIDIPDSPVTSLGGEIGNCMRYVAATVTMTLMSLCDVNGDLRRR